MRENLEFPLKSPILRTHTDEIAAEAGQFTEMLRIAHKLDNLVTALSGGEMQRVGIGRALARDPQVYLMDESLSSLDARLRFEMRVELYRFQADMGATMLYVTHDHVEAMTMATRVGVLDRGRLMQLGTPREICEALVGVSAASRLGTNRITPLPADVFPNAPHGAVGIGLQPEHVVVVRDMAQDARIGRVERPGDQTRLHLTLGPHEIVTFADAHTSPARGDTVAIHPRGAPWFAADGSRIADRSPR